METVSQPSARPTNKLTAAVIGTALVEVARVGIGYVIPEFGDQTMWIALAPIVVYATGWFVKDKPNVQPAKDPVRGI